MGNCFKCFRTSEPTAASTTNSPGDCQITSIEYGSTHNSGSSANQRSKYTLRSHETDELLSTRSPLKHVNNCDTKRSSFKKSLVLLNGNAATMSDIITTAVKDSLEISDNTLNLLFEEYKDPDEDLILHEGVERLCRDLNYQPDEFAILVLAWCLDASQMCRFTKSEFIEGLHKMRADSIETIRKRLEQTAELLKKDAEMFKQLYRFTFRFGLEPDQRILTLDMAMSLWQLVFTVHKPELLDNWLHFLEQHPNIRGIPKDTWNMFLNFSEQCDIYNYDDTEAWPSLFDDFVDYEKARLAEEAAKKALEMDDATLTMQTSVSSQTTTTIVSGMQTTTTTTNASRVNNSNQPPHDDDNNNDDPLHLTAHQKNSADTQNKRNIL